MDFVEAHAPIIGDVDRGLSLKTPGEGVTSTVVSSRSLSSKRQKTSRFGYGAQGHPT